VTGAAIADSFTVVQNELQPAPAQIIPCDPHSMPNAFT
jgi:hypothetical protein